MLNDFLVVLFVCAGISTCALLVSQLPKLISSIGNFDNLQAGYESGFARRTTQMNFKSRMSTLILPYILLELLVMWAMYCSYHSSLFFIPIMLCIAFIARFIIK